MTERLNQDTTTLHCGDVLKFGMSDLPTKQEREAADLKRVAQTAYKTVQVIQFEKGKLEGWPEDPLQLATVAAKRQIIELRIPELQEDAQFDFWRDAA